MRNVLFLLAFTAGCGGSSNETPAEAPAAEVAATEAAAPASPEAAFAEIADAELLPMVDAKSVVIVDVNGSASYNEGHIPGAIDFESQKANLAALLPADKNALVVSYCGGPACNAWEEGAKAVQALGYTQIKHYKGGISGWKAAHADKVEKAS